MDVRTGVNVPHNEYFPAPRAAQRPLPWWATVDSDARELTKFWPVVRNMVVQDLRVRYQRSVLGFFWTLLNPILMMTTMTLVFSQIFKMDKYAIYLFAGMVPWNFLSGSLGDSAFCIIANEGLIRKIYLPKLIFPITRVLFNLTTFVLSLTALFILLVPLGARFSAPFVLLPVAIALLSLFVLGLGLIVATLNTFYRDCGHLVGVFLQAWYFATPIMYEASMFQKWQSRLWLNPAYSFIRIFQIIIRDGNWPPASLFLWAGVIALTSLGIGYGSFKSQENKMVFRL